jgi:MFS family permease
MIDFLKPVHPSSLVKKSEAASQSLIDSKVKMTKEQRKIALANTNYKSVLSNTRGIFGFLSLIMGLLLWTKIDTTLEPKLREDFGYSPSIVSLFYTIQIVGYLIVSPFCHKILEKYDGTLMTVLSFFVLGIASFLIGPSYLLANYLPNSISVMIPGLFLTGLVTSFTTIGTYGEMYEPFIELYGCENASSYSNPHDLYDKDKLNDILAGLYNGGYSIGVIIGPFAASYLMIWLDGSFRKQSDVFAVLTLVFGVVMLYVVYIPKRIKTGKRS